MNPTTPQKLHTNDTDRQVRTIRLSPDGKTLYGASIDGKIRRWDVTVKPSEDEPLPEEKSKKKEAAENPWPELPSLAGHRGWLQSLLISPQHNLLISTDSWGRLCAWDVKKEPPEIKWNNEQAHDGWIRDAALSQDESLVATCGRDKIVRVWSAADGKLLHELAGHEDDVFAVAVHPDNKSLVSGDLFGRLKHWDLASGKCQRDAHLEKMHFYDRDHDVAGLYSLRFHDDGKTLLAAGSEPSLTGNVGGLPAIYWVNWDTLEVAKTMHFGESKQGYVYDYAWHPDGYLMLVTSGAPGAGQFLCQRPDEEKPFFTETGMTNCHSLAFDPATARCIVASTNRSSQGNGAVRDKDGVYVANTSPLAVFEI